MSKSKKQKSLRKQKGSATKSVAKKNKTVLPDFLTNDTFFLIAAIVLAFLYFGYSFFSDGFYQQDGPNHYVSMRNFWQDPNSILSSWSKTGFKVLYAIPALFGLNVVKFMTALFSAFSAYFAYRVTKTYNKNVAFIAFVLMATQHMWVNFSFRFYAETCSAFVLLLGVFFHREEKWIPAALAFSYIGFIRQEAYLIGGLYFLYLLWDKKYIPALATSVFPLTFNIWGFALHGDPLYLINSVIGTAEGYKGAWDKMGFDHYYKFMSEVHGGVVMALVVIFIGSWILSRQKNKDYLIFMAPAAIYLFIQSLFNMQSIIIGPYTGGTVRYLLVIAPLLSIMAALGAANLEKLPNKYLILAFLAPFFLITATYLSFEMPSVTITNIKKWDSTIMIALTSIVALLPTSILDKSKKYYLYAALGIFSMLQSVRPYKIGVEDKTMQNVAEWVNQNYPERTNTPFFVNHPMFYYFSGKSRLEFTPATNYIINDEGMQQAPKGSVIIWESHYGYRPKRANYELQYTYFTEKPQQYKLVKQFTESQRFAALVFEKIQ